MKRFLWLLLACTWLGAPAQIFKEFSSQEAFLTELQQEMVDKAVGDAKKEHKDLLDKFTAFWGEELNAYNADQKARIYSTSVELLNNKLRIIPDVRDYISTIVVMTEAKVEGEPWNAWHRTVDVVISNKSARRDFSNYMQLSSGLFRDKALFGTANVLWKTDNTNYRFEVDGEQPKWVAPSLTLSCEAKGSSIMIAQTSGAIWPMEEKWVGHGGTVTWEKAGLNANEVYAVVKDYEIQMKFSNYDADSVTFFNSNYFNEPILGRLIDKAQAVSDEDRSSFPEFTSYSQRFRIQNIDKNVDYEGGFTQKGARFIASGTRENPAYLTFRLGDKPFLEVSSVSFSIKDDRITSINAAVKFLLHDDSITHPGLDFKFLRDEREIALFRSDEGLQKAPYFDSYHMVDIYAELVRWKIDQSKIYFGTIPNSSDKRAYFESDYYFRNNRFDQVMGLSMDHPLVEIKNCFVQRGQETIWDSDVAKCMKTDITNAQVALLTFTNMGLVKYDPETKKVKSTKRLYHYIAARSEKEDYDVIQINSDIGTKENASLDLVDEVYALTINGIDYMVLSDSHNVALYPEKGTITMKKNRDFDFSGVVQAGRLEFFGSNYSFEYDSFKVEMPKVDSVRITVTTGKETTQGKPVTKKVTTVIETVSGTLEIDRADNKSGLERLKQYPIFTSHEKSYAYYERDKIHNRAYKRENFHFELDPFVFDSLDNFENERLQFDGLFRSAGIFPEFRETLKLQPDYSLGFVRQTPADGFDVYGGKGEFHDTIKMSHEGLRGSGKLKYLSSTTLSTDFLFLPEQMTTIANSFVLEEQMGKVQYPPVTGKAIKQDWKPYEDLLHCNNTKDPFVMYDGSTLKGHLDLSPAKLTGGGLFAFEKAELESKLFTFAFTDFASDTADFRLKTDVSSFEGFQFKTNNVSAKVDFAKRKGDFVSNDGTSKMEFLENLYIAYMDRFTWFMDQDAIELSGGKSQKGGAGGLMQFEGSRFISIHPDQDSLEFYSPAARYDIKNSIINAREVEFIPVADALIYPDSGLVTVQKRAKMETLKNCRIVANSVTKFHRIDSATVDVFARRNYAGSGNYTYKQPNGTKQLLRFTTIGVDSSVQTYAEGEIAPERAFTLSPQFEYRGRIRLNASARDLTFGGYARISHECEPTLQRTWFSFKSEINPEDIAIPIGELIEDEDQARLNAGLVLDPDSGSIYSTFVSPKLDDDDVTTLPATGYLVYHPESKEYRISNASKLVQQSLPGQYWSLHSTECKTYGEGKLGFGVNTGQVKIKTVGHINNDIKTEKLNLDVLILLDFFFDDGVIDNLGKTMAENAQGDPIDFERETYQRGLRELIGAEEADKLISAVTLTGEFKKFPEELEKRFFLTDVQMKWNPETKSYQSIGSIGLGNVGKRQVNTKVRGKLEVVVGSNPEIDLYLEADENTWYYFKYSKSVMQAFSSMDDFNKTISELKADKRKVKTEKGEAPYSYMLSSKRRRDDFIARF